MTSAGTKKKNVIFIIVDALYAKQLGYYGRHPSPSPSLDAIMRDSINFTNLHAVGSPTQFAMPGIFTSTLPLDKKGYEFGIQDRDDSFVEVLNDKGYNTSAFVCGFGLGRLFGYDRGFDDYYSLFDLSLFIYNLELIYLRHYRAIVKNNTVALEQAAAHFSLFIGKFLEQLYEYCAEKVSEIDQQQILLSAYIHRWDFKLVLQLMDGELSTYYEDKVGYTRKLITGEHDLRKQILHAKGGHIFTEKVSKRIRGITGGIRNGLSAIPHLMRLGEIGAISITRYIAQSKTRVASSAYVITNFMRWLEKNKEQPFFSWIHLMDAHDVNYRSFDVAMSKAGKDAELSSLLDFYNNSVNARTALSYKGSLRYDLSINYVDHQIALLLEHLNSKNMLDDTIVVITSDHGSRDGGAGDKGKIPLDSFYDELYHCPLSIYEKGHSPNTRSDLCSALDIAPTLLDYLDIEIPASFRGKSLLRPDRGNPVQASVIMEHLGRGPCDPVTKYARICVMNNMYKIVYEQNLFDERTGKLLHVFDMQNGMEKEIGFDSNPDLMQAIQELLALAKSRAHEIRLDLNDETVNQSGL